MANRKIDRKIGIRKTCACFVDITRTNNGMARENLA